MVDLLNRNYVCLIAQEFNLMNGAWRGLVGPSSSEEARQLLFSLHRSYRARLDRLVQGFIVSPNGAIEWDAELMTRGHGDSVCTFVSRSATHASPGPAGSTDDAVVYKSRAPGVTAPDDLQLRVVARYSSVVDRELLNKFNAEEAATDADFVYLPAFVAPLRDWIVLPRPEAAKLLPPKDQVGTRYDIDAAVFGAMSVHLCPESAPIDMRKMVVRQAHMQGRVESAADDKVVVALTASYILGNPGINPNMHAGYRSARNWTEGRLRGYLRYDARTRQIEELKLVSEQASDNTPTGVTLPFDLVVYRVPLEP